MLLKEAMENRKSYRAFEKSEIKREVIEDIIRSASLAPSCYNNQPWRFVVIDQEEKLKEVYKGLSKGNEWMELAPVIIAIFTEKSLDCVVADREYYLFDTGMATAYLLLKAQEYNLHTHLIAGFKEGELKKTLNIPEEMKLISLTTLGGVSEKNLDKLNEDQRKSEGKRPDRLDLNNYMYFNEYKN